MGRLAQVVNVCRSSSVRTSSASGRAMSRSPLRRLYRAISRGARLFNGLPTQDTSLVFQVICQRYQKEQRVVLTSNKPFGEWGQVFAGDEVMASAALDRLLRRATLMNIRGDSYRIRPWQGQGLAADAAAKGGDR